MNLDKDYWNKRYLEKNTPWDAGEPTTPIKEYADSLEEKDDQLVCNNCS